MSVFHLKWPHMKHEENSIRGIRAAARARTWRGRRKYSEIDLDMLISKDGRIVGCHWARPLERDGFKDPKGLIANNATVDSLTYVQLSRLRARTGPFTYQIQPIERLLAECSRRKINAVLEPKSPHFTQANWDHLAKVADDLGVHIRAYALPNNAASLTPAKRAGLNIKEIR